MLPVAAHYPVDGAAEQCGVLVVDVLNVVRKAKSEAGVSIKYPVIRVQIPADVLEELKPALFDLKSAANIMGEIEPGEPMIVLAPKENVA
jgi:hypothetical protein